LYPALLDYLQLREPQFGAISQHIASTMSTTQDGQQDARGKFGDLNLSIIGLGTEYPPFLLEPSALDILCERHYPQSAAYDIFQLLL
jgi:hypothetical protein